MRLLDYLTSEEYTKIADPTPEQLVECIKSRDTKCYTTLGIRTPSGLLILTRGKRDRFLVDFDDLNDDQRDSRSLIDPSFSEQDHQIPFVLDNGEKITVPIRHTASVDTAIEVAVYFLTHEALPERLSWNRGP